jgi:phosphoglycolate phosphatase
LPRIKGILFDKDGTLVDFDRTWFSIGDMLALEAAGGDRTKADRLMVQAGYDFKIRRFIPDSVFAAGTNADVVAAWYPDLEPTLRQALVLRFNGITATNGAAKAVAIAGVREALATLHQSGYRMGVATNDSTAGAQQTILMLGIASMFEAAYGYDAVARPKPAADTVEAFCDLTGLLPSEIAMIGDNGHDIEMAHNAGCGLSIGVLSGTGTRETFVRARADVVLDSVAELPAFLASRAAD